MRSKHQKKKRPVWPIVCIVFLLCLIGFYGYKSFTYSDQFLPNTKANGVAIGGKTVTAANKSLQEKFAEENFKIVDNGQDWDTVSKKSVGVSIDYLKSLKTALNKQNNWAWLWASMQSPKELKIENQTLDDEKLQAYLTTLKGKLEQLNSGRTATKNATITKGDAGFIINPEVNGNSLDIDQIMTQVDKDIRSGKGSLELENFLQKPTITAKSPELQTKLTEMNKLTEQSYVYQINGQEVAIPKETIMSWLEFDGENVSVNKDGVTQYLTELGTKYNTSTNPTSFNSTKRGTVSVPAGTYGWSIQTGEETEALANDILAGKGLNRAPAAKGATQADHALIGNTYIEVDLVNQHMWYYNNGALVLETDVVTGKPATPTPPGVFYVWNKESPSILKGEDYKTPVEYWMPIDWTGVGIHDSPWQPAYGGERYKTAGSHGCVNTPPSVVAQLYKSASVGTPVLVF